MTYRLEKRVCFVGECINQKLATPNLANKWYIANKCHKLANAEAIEKFKEWLNLDKESRGE